MLKKKTTQKKSEITLAHVLASLDKIDSKLEDRTELLRSEIQGLETQMDRNNIKMNSKIDDGFAKVDLRLAHVDNRLARVDSRLAQVDSQLTRVDSRLDRIENKLELVYKQTGRTVVDVTALESRVSKLENTNA
jgi:chaperonin cofactor prefoldin